MWTAVPSKPAGLHVWAAGDYKHDCFAARTKDHKK